MLRHIAAHGDDEQRARAHATLDTAAHLRGERAIVAMLPSLTAISAGEKRRTIYDARHKRDLPGTRVRGERDAAINDDAVNEAHDGSGKTYDFFKSVFARNSIDGRGLRLDSTVHYGRQFGNAMWNGRQMIYGDGDGVLFNRFTKSLDVIAHELTHGVTQFTAALEYRDESGALNEHFSDVFGILVKQHSLKQRASKADWLIGAELLAKSIHGVAVRSMKAPGTAYDDPILGKDPQPAHIRNYVHGEDDNGGVHVNSGIPNHAFYRVATLLGGNAWEGPGKIWYRTLTRKLRRDAKFQDCADATFRAAGEIFGADSEPQNAVLAAWKSVGITVSAAIVDGRARIPVKRPARELVIASGGAEVPSDASMMRRRG
jgi:Zn-dependent metalloprotease